MNKKLLSDMRYKKDLLREEDKKARSILEEAKLSGKSKEEMIHIVENIKAIDNKFFEVDSDIQAYTNASSSSENSDIFKTLESQLLTKYSNKHKDSKKEEETIFTTKKRYNTKKVIAGSLALAAAIGFGYGLGGCSFVQNNNTVDVQEDEEPQESKSEESSSETTTPTQENTQKPTVASETPIANEEIPTNTPTSPEEITGSPTETITPAVENKNEYVETNDFAYVTSDTQIYDNDSDNKVVIENIEKYQKVLRLSSNGTYDYVQAEDLTLGYIPSSSLEVLPDVFVEVDLSDQTVDLYKENQTILTSLVVTGKDSTPTRIGYFPIAYKTYDTYLKGPGYNCHVNYWMPFDGGIGLHDASWRSEFGGEINHDGGSHGCVNMPNDAAKTIYDNVSTGTIVLVHN